MTLIANAECRYGVCHYAECYYAHCYYTECCGVACHFFLDRHVSSY
jgi:hypothetical protein